MSDAVAVLSLPPVKLLYPSARGWSLQPGGKFRRVRRSARRIAKGLAKHPIPVILLARLAIDREFQGKA